MTSSPIVKRSFNAFEQPGKAFAPTLALLVALTLSACGKGQPAADAGMQALPVTVIEMQPQKVPVMVEAVGQTQGSKEVEVRPRVGGILLKRLYNEGETVKAGAALFQIDRATYDITLMQARANLAQAQANADQAKREATRLQPLVDQKAISQKEYDDATSTLKNSDAAVLASQAQVKAAELNVGYTSVTAPITGVTATAQHSEGSLVAAGTDLLTTMSVTDPIWVGFAFAEADTRRLRESGAKDVVKLVFSDGTSYPVTGKLNFAASTIDTQTGTVQLRAEFANPKLVILPGQFVRVQVVTGEQQAYLVPQSALFLSDLGKVVFVAGPDNKVAPHPVETAGWSGNNWVVTKGLNPGDKLITDNLLKLRPGAPVAPHAAGPAPGAGGAAGEGKPEAAKS
jgi:membrane fusion protein (multidrug efflux system)